MTYLLEPAAMKLFFSAQDDQIAFRSLSDILAYLPVARHIISKRLKRASSPAKQQRDNVLFRQACHRTLHQQSVWAAVASVLSPSHRLAARPQDTADACADASLCSWAPSWLGEACPGSSEQPQQGTLASFQLCGNMILWGMAHTVGWHQICVRYGSHSVAWMACYPFMSPFTFGVCCPSALL